MGNTNDLTPLAPAVDPCAERIKAAVAGERKIAIEIKHGWYEPPVKGAKQRRVNYVQMAVAAVLCLAAAALLYEFSGGPRKAMAAGVVIAAVDLGLIGLLVAVIHKTRKAEPEILTRIPDRGPAFVVLISCFLALVFASCRLNLFVMSGAFSGRREALADAFITALTLNHGHYQLQEFGGWASVAVIFELASIILLLIVFFPLLVSRLAMFAGETGSKKEPAFHVVSASEREWSITTDPQAGGAQGATPVIVTGKAFSVRMTEGLEVKIEKQG